MRIKVLFFAKLREVFGVGSEDLDISSDECRVSSVLAQLRDRGDVWANELGDDKSYRVAINQEMTSDDLLLKEGDEVALFPPVTGG